jgi:hypothetical protein
MLRKEIETRPYLKERRREDLNNPNQGPEDKKRAGTTKGL